MASTPSPPVSAHSLWQLVRSSMLIVTTLSIYGSGLLGIVVVQAVGPFLAMGAQIYTGNTEPHQPDLPWPFQMTLLLGLLPIVPAVMKRFSLAMIASIPLALLPWWQLYQLYLAAGLE